MKRIMIDRDKCEGCLSCYLACMQSHRKTPGTLYDLDLGDPENDSRNHIALSADGLYTPIFCRHCESADCLTSCMSGALSRTPEGLVQYDKDQCAACFMCVINCPYGVLKPGFQNKLVMKCDFCADDEDGPNCVRQCPTQAIYLEEVPV